MLRGVSFRHLQSNPVEFVWQQSSAEVYHIGGAAKGHDTWQWNPASRCHVGPVLGNIRGPSAGGELNLHILADRSHQHDLRDAVRAQNKTVVDKPGVEIR